jgi:succinate dehydrogenase/fumarate reductase flavoprotein subunit
MTPSRNVAVFGAGMAGYCAAVTALEHGATVTLFEKATEVGGSALLSGGLVWTFAELAELQSEIPDGNPILQQVVFDTIAEGRQWLAALGVRFTTADAQDDLAHAGWAGVTGEPGVNGLGQQLEPPQAIDALNARFAALGGELWLESSLHELTTSGGAVTGARVALSDGRCRDVPADAVILATGGFQGNPELLARYIGPPDHLYLRSNSWSTGDGLLAGLAAGGSVSAGLDTFYGHAMIAPPGRFGPGQFGDATQGYGQGAVAVNLRGERFADESEGTGEEVLNQALARQPGGRGFYIVDEAVAALARHPGKPVTRVVIDRARSHGGPVVSAGSLEELSSGLERSFGVPAGTLLNTLTGYNRICGGDCPAQPPRARFRFPLGRPPFYAVAVKASITATMGGLAVDDQLRVLRRSASSSPIAQSITELRDYREVAVPGLFAAGGDVGNVSHRGYAGGLATALTTGRAAGRSAAAWAHPGTD